MAVFSRIVVLAACVVSSALFVDATTPNVNAGGQVTARHLKHPQPRAHHAHVAHGHAARSSKKRSADKKRACAAKNDAIKSLSATVTTTKSHTTTTTKKEATTTTKKTTTKAATATPKPDTGNNLPAPTGGKAGLAWNDGNEPFMKNLLTTGKVTWCYTWSPWTPGGDCEFVPMLWSGKQINDWNKNVAGKTSFKNVLAFNEPEIGGQSEMSVGEAVDLWYQYIKPMKARHGAPAVTTSPKGIAWIKDFMNQCGDSCDIDFLCFHYYGMDPDDFISTIKSLHSQFPGKPIWVTEWACQNYGSNQDKQCSLSTIKSFMAKTQAFLDGADYVERYAWFGALTEFPGNFNTQNRIITTSGALNDLGRQYIAW
ncbi:hypothetical protein FS837_009786 [Tulasnella sp. UAMH 9824]|nr:hypothetical protein FS837_009786 [Tulasnella sp. UAMH 9824]